MDEREMSGIFKSCELVVKTCISMLNRVLSCSCIIVIYFPLENSDGTLNSG